MSKKSSDDNWVENLWAWADENEISSANFPRNKDELLSLTELYLDDEYFLKDIPKELGRLTNLTCLALNIYNDDPKMIPEELGMLTNLTCFSIGAFNDDCNEIHIPKSIANLTQVTELFLSGNISHSSIEMMLESFKELRRLYIDNNKVLKTLPKNIYDHSSIWELVLQNNKNLILTEKQFNWAISLRDDEKGYDKTYCTELSDGTSYSFTTDYGQKFQYYSIIPFDRSEKIPEPNFPSEAELLELDYV